MAFGRAQREVDAGEQRERAGAVVHRDRQPERFGQGADLAGLGDPAGPGRVDHHDVGGAPLEQRPVLVAGDQLLAGEDGRRRRCLELGDGVDVVGQHHVLEPGRAGTPRPRARSVRRRYVPVAVALEHDLDPVPDRLADPAERLAAPRARSAALMDRPSPRSAYRSNGQIFMAVMPSSSSSWASTSGSLIWAHRSSSGPCPRRARSNPRAPVERPAAGVVGRDAVLREPAEQLVDRRPERLAEDVPQRDVDGRDRPHLHARPAPARDRACVQRVQWRSISRGSLPRSLRRGRLVDEARGSRRRYRTCRWSRSRPSSVWTRTMIRNGIVGELDGLDRGDLHAAPRLFGRLRTDVTGASPSAPADQARRAAQATIPIGAPTRRDLGRQRDEAVDHAGEAAGHDRDAGGGSLIA